MSDLEKPILIGLTGKARSGKDTVGRILQGICSGSTVTISFAGPIKEGLSAMFDLTDEHLNGSLKEVVHPDYGVSPRKMMQMCGTDFGRNLIHPEVWVTVAKRRILQALAQGHNVVVTDVRFNNEAAMIRELGGVIWHIRRANAPKIEEHISEAGIAFAPTDAQIVNNGYSMEDLFHDVRTQLQQRVQEVGVLNREKVVLEYQRLTMLYGHSQQFATVVTGVDKNDPFLVEFHIAGPILKYDPVTEIYETPHVVYVPSK